LKRYSKEKKVKHLVHHKNIRYSLRETDQPQ
jgi:hypothetical protein